MKQSWPTFWFCPDIQLEGLRKAIVSWRADQGIKGEPTEHISERLHLLGKVLTKRPWFISRY